MTNHITFDRLIADAQAGHAGSGEVLGYALTGFLGTIFPEFELGLLHFKAPSNARNLFWKRLIGERWSVPP